ncbi:hypothetical protein [Rathayibacter sp. VKM Ac-2805]|uniref:hypothetical protein n=1 Tax=Rathayibacter sp. VKM Ac-2805 TaxID=2609258 RepID=UPI00131FF317|nr:hypothetical protein [Rathayibacter sp. VKM Ac-2805]QHC73777.1 hypothetical protein GSU40_08870 [Rathayibacter sp. VKM Ac-2805]
MDNGFSRPAFDFKATPAPAAKKKKGFFLDQISTGGGIGGALAGAAGGAALGSVVPVVGTAVGGLVGALLGGGIGSAGGELAENAITGDDLGKNVLKEGLIGGATSLPIGAGLKLARAGVKVGTGLGSKSAGQLVQEAGIQTIGKGAVRKGVASGRFDDQAGLTAERLFGGNLTGTAVGGTVAAGASAAPSVTSVGGRLKNAGNKALLSQYGTISKPFARSTDPAGTIATLADAGITKPVDAERLAAAVTGSDGLITKAVSDSVGRAGGVNIDRVQQVFTDAVENYGLVEKDRKSVQAVFTAQMNKLRGGAKGSVATEFNPTEVLSTMRALEKRAADLTGKGDNYRLSTPERADQAAVLKLVRDELEDALYTGAGANKQLSNTLTPALRSQLLDLQPNNPQWAKYVDQNVMGAKTVGDLRGSMAPFVRVGKIIDEGESNSLTAGGRVGNAFNAGGIKSMIGEAVTNVVKNPVANVAGNTLRSASQISGGALRAAPTPGQGALPLAGRQLAGRLLTGSEDAAADPSLETALASSQLGGGLAAGTTPDAAQTNPTGYSSQELGQALMQALAAGDSASADVLKDMYALSTEFESQGVGAELNSVQQKNLIAAGNAETALQQLETRLADAGGGSGVFGGRVANTLGDFGLNGSAKLYNDELQSYVPVILQALGKTDAPSETELKGIIKTLPQITDSPEQARAKLAGLRARIAAAQQNTMLYGGSAATPAL